jgi:thiol-disulfide isomerase/thioredoxin
MKYLENQTQFEELIGKSETLDILPDFTIIWFSAEWCGPCKKINIQMLQDTFPVNWLKCDITRNDYTAGYCGIRSVPTFMVIYKKKIVDVKYSSITIEILHWLENIRLN